MMEPKMMRQKPISIKIPDQILILIDNFVRLGQYESRSHFLRVAIEEMLKQETGTWDKLVDQISGKNNLDTKCSPFQKKKEISLLSLA